jgi:dolichol-phosphate mannosyltransferase
VSGPAWLILPTYDEAANLAPLVAAVRRVLAEAAPAGHRILVVDDASPDGTGAIADRLAAAHDDVCVLHRPGKLGLGRAYRAGFDRALAEGAGHVLQMDADFSHHPEALRSLLAQAAAGADLVLGSRYVPGGGIVGWNPLRRAVSRAGCAYARTVLRVPVRDLTGGLKCFRAEALHRIGYADVRAQGYAFQVELTYRALVQGLRVVEIPIVFSERRQGHSKMTGRIALEAGWRIPALRSGFGGRLPTSGS